MQNSPRSPISKVPRCRPLWLIIPLLFWTLPIFAQSRDPRSQDRRKPALIRDTDVAEGRDSQQETEPKELNPMLAEKNVEIGDFYYKKKNYRAAIQRYLDALEYQPNLIEAYEALARAYEKSDQIDKAMDTYRDFLKKYPDSPKSSDFRSKLANIEKKSD